MAIRDSWAVHRERMRLTMVRINVMVRQALYVLALAASMWSANATAQACSDYPNDVIDGLAGDIPPAQLQIDRNCTIRNFPESNSLSTNFSFFTQPGTQFVNTAKRDFGTYEIATQ